MEYRRLGQTELKVSVISMGGAAIGQQYGPVTLNEVAETVHYGINAGINLIDTSAYYGEGQSETMLGEVLSNGWRDKVVICTKAGRYTATHFDFSAQSIRQSLEASLKRLKTDHVDILLAHDIEFADNLDQVFTETVEVLHQLKREGKCRYIGMSCYPLGLLCQAIEKCQLDVVISYCHYSLQNTRLETELLPVAKRHGVGVLNASPLSMGLLTNQGPPAWHPAPDEIKSACRQAAEHCRSRGSNIAELGMQYCLSQPGITSTITGTAKLPELQANLTMLDKGLDMPLLAEVQKMLEPVKDMSWLSGNYSG